MIDIETFERRARYKFKESTLKRKLENLNLFKEFLERHELELNEESIARFIDYLLSKNMSPGAIRNAFFDIQSYIKLMMLNIDLARVKELIPPNIIREATWLTEDEVKELINCALEVDERVAVGAYLMYEYGRRPGEVLALEWRDIDFDRGKIRFKILKKRYGRDEVAEYPLTNLARKMLSYLPRECERVICMSQKNFNRKFRKIAFRALGKKVTPHVMRHSRITHLRKQGVPLDVVSKYVARHSKIDITIRIYRHIAEEEISKIPSAEDVLK